MGRRCPVFGNDVPRKVWNAESLYLHEHALRHLERDHLNEMRETERFWRKALWDSNNRSVDAALSAANNRLDGMNEFRKTIEDLQGAMITRKEAYGLLAGSVGLVVGLIEIIGKFAK